MNVKTWARWLPGIALAMIFVGSMRCKADRGPLPPPSWLRDQGELQLFDRTFPARWKEGTHWTIEYEFDSQMLMDHVPVRKQGDYIVQEIQGDRALVGALAEARWEGAPFIWDMKKFRLESLPRSEYGAQPSKIDVPEWEAVYPEAEPLQFYYKAPWVAPVVPQVTANGDLQPVLGERQLTRVIQRTWIEGGMVRFQVRPLGHPYWEASIVWRPGDPWWAKYECFVPGRTSSPPTPTRKQWTEMGHRPWPGPDATRPGRARLVAIDGVPIEPLPWEHPPADWMDPSGR